MRKKIWKKAKGRTSQETFMYGCDGWTSWCLYSPEILPSQPYIYNKLKLFDIFRVLNCNRFKLINELYCRAIDALVEHSSFFPPTEQTYALHEMVHLILQIEKVGPPKMNNLFMYERVNSTLKKMIKNKCNSMASIVKAYAVSYVLSMYFTKTMYYQCINNVFYMYIQCIQLEEFITSLIGFKLSNANHIIQLLKFMPIDFNLIQRVVTSFNNLHFDKDSGNLFSIPAVRVHELRGPQKLIPISAEDSNALITLAASISNDGLALEILLNKYLIGQKTFKNFIDYLRHVLYNDENLALLDKEVNMIIYITLCMIFVSIIGYCTEYQVRKLGRGHFVFKRRKPFELHHS